jgi:uncharacterized protein (TIGR02246 family)
MRIKLIAALPIAAGAVASPVCAAHAAQGEAGVIAAYIHDWDSADPRGLAAHFEPDGRLVIPTGNAFAGQQAIRAFYSGAFERGYRRSIGSAAVTHVIPLAANLSLVDGDWSIHQARTADGSERAPESGQFSAVLRRDRGGWRIVELRETALAH